MKDLAIKSTPASTMPPQTSPCPQVEDLKGYGIFYQTVPARVVLIATHALYLKNQATMAVCIYNLLKYAKIRICRPFFWHGYPFQVIMGKQGFYNGKKYDNFEISFLARITYQCGSTVYQKMQNCNMWGVCFLRKVDIVHIFIRKS